MLPRTPTVGLAIVAVAFLFAPGMDVFAKWLVRTHGPAMVGFLRFGTQTAILLVLLALCRAWGRPRLGYLAGGILMGMALVAMNAALAVMPVANALAIFFVEPFILTILSALILKERVGWHRISAVAAGLIGAVIILRPNWAAYGPAAAWPLATAFCFACYMLVTRVMSMGGQILALQFWMSAFAALFLAVLVSMGGIPGVAGPAFSLPQGSAWLLVIGMGATGVAVHQMLAHGLMRAGAGQIAPLQYLEIVSATALGWLVFGDFPDTLTWVGTAIIIGAGLYVFHRERRLGELA